MPKSWYDPEDEAYDPTEGLKEMLEKEKAKEKRYSIYGEEYTINELKYISKGLNKGDNQISVFNEHLKNKRLKDAVDILKLNNLIK